MKLIKRDDKYELQSSFEERAFPKDARFRWNPERKIWWTDKKENAARLIEFADDEVRAELTALAVQQQTAMVESRAVDSDIDIPIAEGQTYMPFQKAGIAVAIKRLATLLADEPGLGKTIQAIGIINATPEIQRVLVICPASLKINWSRECQRFLARRFDILVGSGKFSTDLVNRLKRPIPLEQEIRKERAEKPSDISGVGEIPVVEIAIRPDAPGVQGSLISISRPGVATELQQPVDQSLVRLVDADTPMLLRDRLSNASFAIDNTGDVSQVGNAPGHIEFSGNATPDRIDEPANLELMFERHIVDANSLPNPDPCLPGGNEFDGRSDIGFGHKRSASNAHSRPYILIVNYDVLRNNKAALLAMQVDLLIVDEAHYCKNPKAQRTQLVFDLAKLASRKAFLTGTPILNRPIELFPLLEMLDPDRWKSFFGYAKRYAAAFKTKWGWDFSGASNLDELQRILRETIMVRRLKADVLTDLPAKVRQIIELPASDCGLQIAEETEAEDRLEQEVEALEAARDFAEATENVAAYETAVAKLQDARRSAFTEMARLRHQTALAKVPAVINHCKEMLDSVPKLCVWAHHHDVIAALMAGLQEFGAVRLTGEDSTADRQASVDRFQGDPKCRVFVGSLYAAGVGLTLTAASTAIFAELDWVPGVISQCEDRQHRIGQHDSVLVQHLVLDGSMDCRLAKTLVAKQEVIDKALDRAAAAIQVEVPSRRRQRSPAELVPATEAQIPAVHAALQFLSARCDHARAIDGQGFNKMDAQFGHDLAGRPRLTVKQATFGLRMVTKYRRQLPDALLAALKIGGKN